MVDFDIHDEKTAPEQAKETLGRLRRKFGFVPNVFGVMAESPALVNAYASLEGVLQEQGRFSEREHQVVILTASVENRCGYCASAHTTGAAAAGVPDEVLQAVREVRPIPDPRLEALRAFTQAVIDRRGHVGEEELVPFLEAGFERAHALEVIGLVALKTLSNYTNHMARTPLDKAFAGQRWEEPAHTTR